MILTFELKNSKQALFCRDQLEMRNEWSKIFYFWTDLFDISFIDKLRPG